MFLIKFLLAEILTTFLDFVETEFFSPSFFFLHKFKGNWRWLVKLFCFGFYIRVLSILSVRCGKYAMGDQTDKITLFTIRLLLCVWWILYELVSFTLEIIFVSNLFNVLFAIKNKYSAVFGNHESFSKIKRAAVTIFELGIENFWKKLMSLSLILCLEHVCLFMMYHLCFQVQDPSIISLLPNYMLFCTPKQNRSVATKSH